MIRFSKLLICLIFITTALGFVYAQTPISGSLSGVLPVDEYLVTGDIYVDDGNSLIIQPGSDFLIQPGYNFTIQGHLEAVGTQQDKIRFKRAVENIAWGHIVFDYESSDSSLMDYCEVEGGYSAGDWPHNCGGGILVQGPDMTISNCTITGNKASYCGGGMAFYSGGDATVINCQITGNITEDDGGGAEVYGSAPTFINCVFQYNDASSSYGVGGGLASGEGGMSTFIGCSFIENRGIYGGGYYCDRSEDVVFQDCIFDGNMAELSGGGLFFYEDGWGAQFDGCSIINNTAEESGGGLYSNVSEQFIEKCTFSGNSSPEGSAIRFSGSDALVSSCIIENNIGSASIHFNYSFYGDVKYSDFYNNPAGDFSGVMPDRIGVITGINSHGTPCDNYMNIFEDPLFVDPLNGDYNLTINSECIDAGDPTLPFDGDGTTADMGAFFFDQSIIQITLTAQNPPILIPANGGTFEFSVLLANLWMYSQTVDFWTEAILPDGSTYGPILLRPDINIAQYDSLYREGITQFVPSNAPSGNYIYVANIGEYPDVISNSAQFDFEKSESSDNLSQISDWYIEGWDECSGSMADNTLPSEFILSAPCPNPFNPTTIISFQLQAAGHTELTIYDIAGREVAKLVDGFINAGSYEFAFDGSGLSSGVYFARLDAGGFTGVQKMLLVK